MNDTFSFKRFALLLKAYWKENKKREIWLLVLLILLLIVLFIQILVISIKTQITDDIERYVFHDYDEFYLVAAVYLVACAGNIFRSLSKKEKAMFTSSIPSSAFERTVAAFVTSLIVYPIIFLALTYVIDFFVLGIYNHVNGIDRNHFVLNKLTFNDYFGYCTLLSAVVFGTVYFKKDGKPKALLVILVFMLAQMIIVRQFTPEGAAFTGGINNLHFAQKGTGRLVSIDGFLYYFKYLLFPLFWILTFLRLKEKEV